jgi:uncharacterized membrane-anchored protein YhcB (DUF1043 family)
VEVPFEFVTAGFAGMAAGMLALWRSQVKSQARCEANEIRLGKKVDELDRYQRNEMADHAERSAAMIATALPLLDRATRILKRHEKASHLINDDTPFVNPVTEDRKHS